MVTSKPRMIFSRLSADAKATGFSRYVVYLIQELKYRNTYTKYSKVKTNKDKVFVLPRQENNHPASQTAIAASFVRPA